MAEDFNHFDELAEAFEDAIKQTVKKCAFDIQANAAASAPVDTGFLRNSIYTVTSDSSTYKGGGKSLPEVEKPDNDTTAYVAVGAAYGIYQELGTRFTTPHPFFYPAVDKAKGPFEDAMAKIEDKMREAGR